MAWKTMRSVNPEYVQWLEDTIRKCLRRLEKLEEKVYGDKRE